MPVESSWADIMDDEDVVTPMMTNLNVSLPSAPKSVQGPEFDLNSIPPNGPFRFQVANLSYEVNDDMLAEFFKDYSVSLFIVALFLPPTNVAN